MFQSALSPDAVLATVARTTDEERMTLFSFSGYKGDRPLLSKVGADTFRLRKRIFYHNSFARYFFARLVADSGGTCIEGQLKVSSFVRVFMTFWFGLLVLSQVFVFITGVQAFITNRGGLNAENIVLYLVPAGMLIFGWLLVSLGLRLSRKGEREMIEFVEQTLVARRIAGG